MLQRVAHIAASHRQRRRVGVAALAAVAALGLVGCSGGDGGGSAPTATTAAAAPRPSSPARLTIVSPRNGQTVHGGQPELLLNLAGGKIVKQTTTHIRGDEGHIHLLVDGKLVDMNYSLSERLPRLTPGQHVIQVEFVAADHVPFEPRILTQSAFQVAK
jgi:hypothetical protein